MVLAVAAGVSSAPDARADDAREQQLAQALFDDARRLMEKKRYGEACPKLAESQRLDPGGGTLLNLAICHEKEGRLATAKGDYDEALAVALRDKRRDRQQIARERLAAIDAAIPRISVVVPIASDTEGLEVKLDGLVLRRAAWGVATPVDPGAHVIEANAPARSPWSKSIVIEASQKKTVEVGPLPLLSALPPSGAVAGVIGPEGAGLGGVLGGLAGPPSPSANASGIQRPTLVTPDDDGAGSATGGRAPSDVIKVEPGHTNPVYIAALSVMLVAAGTSTVTGILSALANKDAKDGCLPDRKYCRDQASADAADRSSTLAWVSSISLGVAAAGLVALIIAPRRTSPSRRTVEPSASALPGGGSVGLSGSF